MRHHDNHQEHSASTNWPGILALSTLAIVALFSLPSWSATGDCESTVNNLSVELERITGTLAGGSMCQAQRPLYDYYRNRAIPEIRRACPASNADAAQTLAYLQGEVDRMTPMFTPGGMCNVR